MILDEYFECLNDNANVEIYLDGEDTPIEIYDGKDSIPDFLNGYEVLDFYPDAEKANMIVFCLDITREDYEAEKEEWGE